MRKIFAIAVKELKTYFMSPSAYIILIICVAIFNFFFFVIIDENREATLRDVFLAMHFIFMTVIPIITMKVFSEEKASGTLEFLLTTPTTPSTIVLGKYLGSGIFLSIIIAVSSVYLFILEVFGSPDILSSLCGYLGVLLQGCAAVAIGVFISSLTKSQAISGILTYVVLFFIYFAEILKKYVPEYLSVILTQLSSSNRAEGFNTGVISLSDLVYYLSIIIFSLVLSRLSLERRN
ncbi:MAG: ABC transporter permease subunit [Candidatus Omnitrophica bacterium]|nr:ABC transporter permease subunit [Candidatus Omnitrophota bacterium]